jgi:hypothetical protein
MTQVQHQLDSPTYVISDDKEGAVAGLVGIDDGVVSGVINLESSGVEDAGLETTP